MTTLQTIQSWPREQLESAFTQREDQLAKALEAEKLARAGFDRAAAERDQLENAIRLANYCASDGFRLVANMGTDKTWECFFTRRDSQGLIPEEGDYYGAGDTLCAAIHQAHEQLADNDVMRQISEIRGPRPL